MTVLTKIFHQRNKNVKMLTENLNATQYKLYRNILSIIVNINYR